MAGPAAAPAPSVSLPATVPVSSGGGLIAKVLIALLLMIGLFVLAIAGSCAYAAYRAKKKADEIREAYKSNDLNRLEGAIGIRTSGGPTRKPTMGFSFPTWDVASAGSNPMGSGGSVPLAVGLTVVTAINDINGDYESVKTIQEITPNAVRLSYTADLPDTDVRQNGSAHSARTQRVSAKRVVSQADLHAASEYMEYFGPTLPDNIRGTTAITVSTGTLEELKQKGHASFTYSKGGLQALFGGILGALAGGELGPDGRPQLSPSSLPRVKGTLQRAEANDIAVPVIVNDQRTSLPAVHARLQSGDDKAEFYILNDARNPLMLAWQIGPNERLQVVKISLPKQQSAARQIEQKLNTTGRVDVYGIYFDFASDAIRPESEPVLAEIAQVLKNNPGWKLTVDGHTDNIGGDSYNLDLSKRRAVAVKQALTTRYHIASDQLTTEGFGASRPKATNDTLEGRALNRRVELVRQ